MNKVIWILNFICFFNLLHLVRTRYHEITIIFKMLESKRENLIFGKNLIYFFYIIIYTFIFVLSILFYIWIIMN